VESHKLFACTELLLKDPQKLSPAFSTLCALFDGLTFDEENVVMAELWVANIEDNTTDEEIKTFLCHYGFPPFDSIRRVEGTGERPAVVLEFNDIGAHVLQSLQPRVHNMFWKSRTLTVQVVPTRDES
jgi:hypothetical protein